MRIKSHYELCGTQILPSDSPFILGALLLRMLPPRDFKRKDQFMSILRILAHNPALASGKQRALKASTRSPSQPIGSLHSKPCS